MKDRNSWVKIAESGDGKNRLQYDPTIEYVDKPTIKLTNHLGEETRNFDDLDHFNKRNRAEIKIKFRLKDPAVEPTKKDAVKYHLANYNKMTSDNEYQMAKKDAHIKFLFETPSKANPALIEKPFNNCGDNIKYTISCTDNGGYRVIVEHRTDTSSKPKISIEDEKITLDFYFYLADEIKADDIRVIHSKTEQPKKPNFWTPTKVLLLVGGITIIGGLIYKFRERIWKWIKGRTKQEEKVERQLDIF